MHDSKFLANLKMFKDKSLVKIKQLNQKIKISKKDN